MDGNDAISPPRRYVWLPRRSPRCLPRRSWCRWCNRRVALRVAVGLEDRDDYLLCREPTYRAAIVANHVLAADAHILSQEEGVLYFDRRVTLADAFRRQWGDPPPGATPMDWWNCLRDAGFTHCFWPASCFGQPSNHDSPLCRPDNLLDAYLFRCADGSLRRYRLVALK